MRTPLLLLILLGFSLAATRDMFEDDEDEDSDEPLSKPRVAWVPIVQRNVTAAVGKALETGEMERDRLNTIGKMLGDSYDKWTKDAEEGEERIRELEINTTAMTSSAVAISCLLMFFY